MLMAEALEIIVSAILVVIILLAIAAAVGILGAVAYKFFCMVSSILQQDIEQIMSTEANIYILGTDVVFGVDREGYPDYIVDLLRDIAKKCNSKWELVGRLFVELWDSELLVLNPLEYAYEYYVDFENNIIEYEEDGKTITKKLRL